MIVSENNITGITEFKNLMYDTNTILNEEAKRNSNKVAKLKGVDLEPFVEEVMNTCSVGTPFEGTIIRYGDNKFPDIVANKLYGVEVKTSINNHWKTIGNSILETTRIDEVEHIFMLFGKLAKPIEFKIRPYKECLSGVAVTHYPRYQIDMNLEQGQSIFDKIGIEYDDLRKSNSPTIPIAQYYRSKLKEGQSLWWAGDTLEDFERPSPIEIKIWNTLSKDERNNLLACGISLFPEILFSSSSNKYNRFTLWMVTNCGVITPNVRDLFSAGGRIDLHLPKTTHPNLPRVFETVNKHKQQIYKCIMEADTRELIQYWGVIIDSETQRFPRWLSLCSSTSSHNDINVKQILNDIFSDCHF